MANTLSLHDALPISIGVKVVDASDKFFAALAGITDPEAKRKVIGEQFIRVFEQEARTTGARCLLQGTIYPDRIESEGGIKSHHNVGGMPLHMEFDRVIEPLRDLYKDEVREVAGTLGLPPEIQHRMPFPGPGLAVRVIGEVTREKVEVVRAANASTFYDIVMDLCARYPGKVKFVQYNTGGMGEIIKVTTEGGKAQRQLVRKTERVPLALGDPGLNQYKIDCDTGTIYFSSAYDQDIPETGELFAKVCKDAGVDAVILFPQAGPETEKAWIKDWKKEERVRLEGLSPGEQVPKLGAGHQFVWVK
jgi:hypothetical protein